jgi:hypothetical protein
MQVVPSETPRNDSVTQSARRRCSDALVVLGVAGYFGLLGAAAASPIFLH